MTRYLAAYAVTALVLVLVDLLWLGVIAKPLYQKGIGHLMAVKPRLGVAVLFYAIYVFGLMVFTILPYQNATGWHTTAAAAALFGFIAYATYDLTNLATLRDWPISLTLADLAWGTLVSALSASAGKLVLDRIVAP